jgi:hypothetical protein
MSLLDTRTEAERLRDLITGPDIGVTESMIENAKNTKTESLLPVRMAAPLTPRQQAEEKYGKGETTLRMLGTMLTGGLLGGALLPEASSANKAQYKSDLALYQKQLEMGLVDPQDLAVANAIRAGVTGPELMALQAEAGGLDKLGLDPVTLSPGQIRFDAFGNTIASGGDPVVTPTAVIQNASRTAQGYGIPTDSRAYSDLVAAYAEPSGSQTLADGTVVPFNTVDKVLSDWKNGYYGQAQGQPSQAGQAQPQQGRSSQVSGVGADGSVSPEGARDATVRKVMNAEQAENLKIADQKISFYNDLEGVMANFGEWDPDANDGAGGFTVNEATRDNYGSWQNHPFNPGSYEIFKGADEKDSLVYMDQLVDMLTVDERGKLKGQGQITEGETAMLKRAVTSLQNRNLSDGAIKREMEKLMRGLIERRQKFTDLQSTYGPKGHGGGGSDEFDALWNEG